MVVKGRWIKWMWPVLRVEGKMMKKNYQGNLEERRPLGKPTMRRQDGVMNDLRILGAKQSMARDRTT